MQGKKLKPEDLVVVNVTLCQVLPWALTEINTFNLHHNL